MGTLQNKRALISVTFVLPHTVYHHHNQNVLPKGRSFTANSGTKAAVLFKDKIPLQTQEPRL